MYRKEVNKAYTFMFLCRGLIHTTLLFVVQVRLRTEVLCTPSSTRSGFEFMTTDHNSTFHVTETFALTSRPSVASPFPTYLQWL